MTRTYDAAARNEEAAVPDREVASTVFGASGPTDQPAQKAVDDKGPAVAIGLGNQGAPPIADNLRNHTKLSIEALSQLTVRRVIGGTLVVIGVSLGFWLLYRFYMVVFIFFAALSVQIALEPAIEYLHRRGIQRKYGVILIYLLSFLIVAPLSWLLFPILVNQIVSLVFDLPHYYTTMRTTLSQVPNLFVQQLLELLPTTLSFDALSTTDGTDADALNTLWNALAYTGQIGFILIAVLALAFSWTVEGERVVRRMLLRAPQAKREELRALIEEMEGKIGAYFRGQAILCLAVGLASVVIFFLLGVPNALVLGLIMAVTEAVPVIGPIIGTIPAVAMTLSVAPEKVLWVIAGISLIQLLENNLLVPRIMDQSVGVNAIVSILSISAFGILFGIGGAILAIPLAAMLQILIRRFLFALPAPEETVAETSTTQDVSRSQVGRLRLAARALAQDVRKQGRTENNGELPENSKAERVEDLIEAIALDLDRLLVQQERHA